MSNPFIFPGVPIGGSITTIILIILQYSLMKSFVKRKKVSTPMKVTSISLCISNIMYTVWTIIGQSDVFLPRSLCSLRITLSWVFFLLARAFLFYFLIIRIELSFKGSTFAFSPRLMKGLKLLVIIVYPLCLVAQCIFAPYQQYTNGVCLPAPEIFPILMTIQVMYGLTDFVLGIGCFALYLHRLYILYKEMKIMGACAMDAQNNNANDRLLRTIKKQAKLSYISYKTTVIFVIVAPALGYTYFGYIDALLNVLCVYCTFDFNRKTYRYLCDCGGKRYLQFIFCYIGCCCCNDQSMVQKLEATPDPETIKSVGSKSSKTETSPVPQSNNGSETV